MSTRTKRKLLIKSIIINKQKIKVLAMLLGLSLISTKNFIELNKKNNTVDYQYIEEEAKEKTKEANDNLIMVCKNIIILATKGESYLKKDYTIENDNLVDNEGNIVSLKDNEKTTFLFDNKLSEKILKNIHLKESKAYVIGFNGSAVGNYVVDYLPETVKSLSLLNCAYITDLSKLPEQCPNLIYLNINKATGLDDFSFIYKMPNLEEVYISESAFITPDLVNYLDNKGIKHNLGIMDIATSIKLDSIIDSIIKPNMTDKQKINAIVNYVSNNMSYNMNEASISNDIPLTQALTKRSGVCVSYAYLTNALLKKAHIDAYKVINDNHAWNLVNLDGKYYYIDPTNLKQEEIYKFILEYLNIGKNYMIDPDNTFNTSMTKPNDNKTRIPLELIEDIANGKNKKTLLEKYGHEVINRCFYIANYIVIIATYLGLIPMIGTVLLTIDTVKRINEDYEDEKEKRIIKMMED